MSAEKSSAPDAKPTPIEEIDVTSVDGASAFLDSIVKLAQETKFKDSVEVFQRLGLILSRVDNMLELEITDQDRVAFLRSLQILRDELFGALTAGEADKRVIAKVQEALTILEEALRTNKSSSTYFTDAVIAEITGGTKKDGVDVVNDILGDKLK